jgi:hypothetical protein
MNAQVGILPVDVTRGTPVGALEDGEEAELDHGLFLLTFCF